MKLIKNVKNVPMKKYGLTYYKANSGKMILSIGFLKMAIEMSVVFLILSGCAGLKVKDLNKVDQGMTKAKVLSVLGDPSSKRMNCGREIYEYDMKDEDGDVRSRVVEFQDGEVSYYGKASGLAACSTKENDRSGNTNTNTVSPTITVGAPTVNLNPVINVNSGSGPTPMRLPAGSGSYFHEIPTVDDLQKQN